MRSILGSWTATAGGDRRPRRWTRTLGRLTKSTSSRTSCSAKKVSAATARWFTVPSTAATTVGSVLWAKAFFVVELYSRGGVDHVVTVNARQGCPAIYDCCEVYAPRKSWTALTAFVGDGDTFDKVKVVNQIVPQRKGSGRKRRGAAKRRRMDLGEYQ